MKNPAANSGVLQAMRPKIVVTAHHLSGLDRSHRDQVRARPDSDAPALF